MFLRMVNKRVASASLSQASGRCSGIRVRAFDFLRFPQHRCLSRRSGRFRELIIIATLVPNHSAQSVQRLGQVARMGILIGRVLVPHHPPVRRTRRGTYKEQLFCLRSFQQFPLPRLLGILDWRVLTEVDFCAHFLAQQSFAI